MQRRFGYRIVRAQWSGKGSSHYDITLRVIGNDDIGIVSNITNIISKDEKIVMRSIGQSCRAARRQVEAQPADQEAAHGQGREAGDQTLD